jgi:hypothetical protein
MTAYSDPDFTETSETTSSFREGQYVLFDLAVVASTDNDGDGVVDNHLPNALAAVDVLVPEGGFDLATFNETLRDNVANHSAVLLGATHRPPQLQLALLAGARDGEQLTVDPAALGPEGEPLVVLEGAFDDEHIFHAGPGMVELPIVGAEGLDPMPVRLEMAHLGGTLDAAGSEGVLTGVLPIAMVIEAFVEPLLPEEGYDLDGDGILESHAELLDFVADLAPLIADTVIEPYGELGVTARLSFAAEAALW